MGRGSRLALLMLTATVAVYPPSDPPGDGPMGPVETAVHSACGRKSASKSGNRYWCRVCEIWFTPDKTARPGMD
jgi:hypothetical protein